MTTATMKTAQDMDSDDTKVRPDYLEREWWTTVEASHYATVAGTTIRNWMNYNFFSHRSKYTQYRVHGASFMLFIDTGKPHHLYIPSQSTT